MTPVQHTQLSSAKLVSRKCEVPGGYSQACQRQEGNFLGYLVKEGNQKANAIKWQLCKLVTAQAVRTVTTRREPARQHGFWAPSGQPWWSDPVGRTANADPKEL